MEPPLWQTNQPNKQTMSCITTTALLNSPVLASSNSSPCRDNPCSAEAEQQQQNHIHHHCCSGSPLLKSPLSMNSLSSPLTPHHHRLKHFRDENRPPTVIVNEVGIQRFQGSSSSRINEHSHGDRVLNDCSIACFNGGGVAAGGRPSLPLKRKRPPRIDIPKPVDEGTKFFKGFAEKTLVEEISCFDGGHYGYFCKKGSKQVMEDALAVKTNKHHQGGFIDFRSGSWRVQGTLAVSRSIGNSYLKVWCVSSEPDVKELQITSDCEFLIMASDGLWDKVSNQEVVDIARISCVKRGKESVKGIESAPTIGTSHPKERKMSLIDISKVTKVQGLNANLSPITMHENAKKHNLNSMVHNNHHV